MSLARLLAFYAGMLVLLGVSVALALGNLPYKGAAIMLLATAQAALLLTGFVELQRTGPLVRLVALSSVLFLALLLTLSLADSLTR
jgi:cytochrome c oxidase subunit 4